MGFIGSLRRIAHSGQEASAGVVDATRVSRNLVQEAKRFNLSELTDLFSNKYVRAVDNKVVIGATDFDNFVRHARRGDYANSFELAFGKSEALKTPSVQRAARKALNNAASELPDKRLLEADEQMIKIKQKYRLENMRFQNADEIGKYVAQNPELESAVHQLLKRTQRTGYLKLFGYSVAVSAGAFTAYSLYEFCINQAAKSTGCFIYTKSGDNIIKCKVREFSCRYPNDGDLCGELDLPPEIAMFDNKNACNGVPNEQPSSSTTPASQADEQPSSSIPEFPAMMNDAPSTSSTTDETNPPGVIGLEPPVTTRRRRKRADNDSNDSTDCLSDKCQSSLYPNLKENQIMRCDVKTPGDILAEAIGSIGSEASSVVSHAFSGILHWVLIGLAALVVLALIFKFVVGPLVKNLLNPTATSTTSTVAYRRIIDEPRQPAYNYYY